jgi:enoyl-CoA hydratase
VTTEAQEKAYETILVERDARVGIITLNRPKALNALNSQVMNEVTTAAAEFDNDPGIGAIIITGSAKAFAAGADIKEMSSLTFSGALGQAGSRAHADDRRGRRTRTGRRLRTRDDV